VNFVKKHVAGVREKTRKRKATNQKLRVFEVNFVKKHVARVDARKTRSESRCQKTHVAGVDVKKTRSGSKRKKRKRLSEHSPSPFSILAFFRSRAR